MTTRRTLRVTRTTGRVRSSIVSARPTWISGAARLVDLGGVFNRHTIRLFHDLTDQENLAADWARVGSDLTRSMDKVAS